MRKALITVLTILLAPAALLSIPSTDGVYVAVKSDAQNQKIIDAGIEQAIEEMSFITRPIAKRKLENTNRASKQIAVKKSGKELTVRHDDRAAVQSEPNGKEFTWTREDGEKFRVSQSETDDEVTQVYRSDDGTKTMVYRFSGDLSKMTLDVKVESPKLAAPLAYSIEYARK